MKDYARTKTKSGPCARARTCVAASTIWLMVNPIGMRAAGTDPPPDHSGTNAPADRSGTNDITDILSARLTMPPIDTNALEARYQNELDRRGIQHYYDAFGSPPAQLLLWQIRQGSTVGFQSYVTSQGISLLRTSALDSLREVAVAVAPIDEWESAAGSLFKGSVGNTAEEHADPASAAPSYAELANRLSLELTPRNGPVQYGVRPWQADPYAYAQAAIGHIEGHPLIIDIRCRTFLEPYRFGRIRIEGGASVALFDDCRLVVGAFIAPDEVPSRTWAPSSSFRLEKETRVYGVVGYIGLALSPVYPSLCTFGFEKEF